MPRRAGAPARHRTLAVPNFQPLPHEYRGASPSCIYHRYIRTRSVGGGKAGGVRAPAPMPATTASRRSGVTWEERVTLESPR